MSTAEEIRSEIAARKQVYAQKAVERDRAHQEVAEATERQRLRRELEEVNSSIRIRQLNINNSRIERRMIDNDNAGPHATGTDVESEAESDSEIRHGEVCQSFMDAGKDVVDGEIEWSIRGFSWLEHAMNQNFDTDIMSEMIKVGGHRFSLIYSPSKGGIGNCNQRGSLAIYHHKHETCDGISFRYAMFIKSKEQGYVQWGERGYVSTLARVDGKVFGPDVCRTNSVPDGIFGMSHAQLIQSEWVIDDALTAKMKVEVRPQVGYEKKVIHAIAVPPSSLGDSFLQLLDSAVGSDVTFTVRGEVIKAHSQILCARSEVLQRQFSCGMQESTSKEVTIEDCDPVVFKAFLRYLYSDNFAAMETVVEKDTSIESAAAGGATANGPKMTLSVLQQLLAVSHKYQVNRLQLWCESKLCELISVEKACSVLQQAHLYEAKQLEERCLDYIAENMNEVIKTEEFAALIQQWPQVSLKITCRVARVKEGSSAAAMKMYETSRKRKRED
eukprot:gnl/MRDRNA2_/MRDRNA2_101079_c0_seq1.p1 gnl/MRDRNA2_/MRDRNA2_101079_c0~~gnl/MRDRNA2_/MRDRNA2_101079_c0_seq1.p1  ORF type:complete len:500 (+),score=104.35 gnl/MRDRNA2_/MRDRNA2_101079_c0_seq1:78-1577(+)